MRIRLLSSIAAVSLVAIGGACVTRTVYVVDDNPRNDAPPRTVAAAPARPAPAPVVEQAPVVEAAPGATYVEDEAGIRRVDDFYEPLSPYGEWVSYPGYGMVFVPSASVVGAGFRPYTHGHWEYSEWGWTWVDHHPFGWATGHYGRWFYDGSYGWVWVPGTTWAPAWVSWRTGNAYVGWAPLPPGAEFGGVYSVYDTSWVFVPYGALGVAYVGSAIIVGAGYRTCYVETYPASDTYVVYGRRYYRGPDEDDVARGGGHVIHRPAHDADKEHPVTRPPEGSVHNRPSTHGNNTAPGSTGRTRDGGTNGAGGGRGDGRRDDARDDGHNDGRNDGRGDGRNDGRPRDDRPRDDARGTESALPENGRPQPGRGPAQVSEPGRGPAQVSQPGRAPAQVSQPGREPEGQPGTPERGRPVDVTPREDPRGAVVDPHQAVVGPRPIEGRDESPATGGVNDGGRRGRFPYTDVTRPTGADPVDPNKVTRPDRPGIVPVPGVGDRVPSTIPNPRNGPQPGFTQPSQPGFSQPGMAPPSMGQPQPGVVQPPAQQPAQDPKKDTKKKPAPAPAKKDAKKG